jgi:hypothetical protein
MTRLQRGQSAMNEANQLSKIAFVLDYLPRRCGIAITQDLRDAVAAQYPEAECGALTINDVPEGYDYGPEVHLKSGAAPARLSEAVNFLRFNGFLTWSVCSMSSGSMAADRGAISWQSSARSTSPW